MVISNFDLIKENGTLRVEADIRWEEKPSAPFRFFIQTEARHKDTFWADPNAMLIAALLPAWQAGEKRIRVEGTLCPVLADKLEAVFMTIQAWYPDEFGRPPLIEASQGFKVNKPFRTGTMSLLSCGIDSLAILRANRQHLPDDHPDAIRATVFVAHHAKPAASLEDLHRQAKGRLPAATAVSQDAGCVPIPVSTNVWWLNPDNTFFSFKSHGAQLSACMAFFSKGFHKGYIASSFDGAYMHKHWGSHPLLDSFFSTAYFQIEHTGVELTRMKKTALVAHWPAGLQNIRVCQNDSSGSSNCGTCEKCIRTMTMLEALGKLRECRSFPENNIHPERMNYLREYNMLFDPEQVYLYRMAIPLLKQRERHDLVETMEEIFDAFFEKRAYAT
ncbi:MAG: hypothetical protein L6Q97_01540 [Thermoanaerobaculia bacterium]|nr:hypothetical protein [Thermoanaerobaculia bacterium]